MITVGYAKDNSASIYRHLTNARKNLSVQEKTMVAEEFEKVKINSTLTWVLWLCGFLGFFGLHTIPLKDMKGLIKYISAWVITVVLAILAFSTVFVGGFTFNFSTGTLIVFVLLLLLTLASSLFFFITWIVDGIYLTRTIEDKNNEIEIEVIQMVKSTRNMEEF